MIAQVVEQVLELQQFLPFHPLFDKGRYIRRSVRREELKGLAEQRQSH